VSTLGAHAGHRLHPGIEAGSNNRYP